MEKCRTQILTASVLGLAYVVEAVIIQANTCRVARMYTGKVSLYLQPGSNMAHHCSASWP